MLSNVTKTRRSGKRRRTASLQQPQHREVDRDWGTSTAGEEQDENRYVVPGDMKLSDFNNLSRFSIEDPRMTTVGGVLYRHLDRLAGVGDSVQIEGIMMTVLALDGHRIAQVAVERGGKPVEVPEPEASA